MHQRENTTTTMTTTMTNMIKQKSLSFTLDGRALRARRMSLLSGLYIEQLIKNHPNCLHRGLIHSSSTQNYPAIPQIACSEAKYTLQSSLITQQPPRPLKTTLIAYTEAKYNQRASITTQQPSRSPKRTQIAETEAKYAL